MSAPQHDPELFDALMRAERPRRPVKRYLATALIFGLLMVVVVAALSYRAASSGERLPENTAHGLDVVAGQCFWSPTGTGEVDVLLRPCTAGHTAEAFAVLPLTEGLSTDVDQPYQRTVDRCTAAARPIPGARVQVMTPNSWTDGKHRAVCYYHFATEVTGTAR
ncbi:hypothetical protein PV458_37395 [Streptomyces sp. MN03-5084-2B]|nr:hypothetical protein [Streptomyces sp. MN03-5084-2B]